VTKVHVPMDPISNKFRGTALVDLPTQDDMFSAIDRLHNLEVCGQRLIVAEEKLLKRPGFPARRDPPRGDSALRELPLRGNAAILRENGRDLNGYGMSPSSSLFNDFEDDLPRMERPPLQRMPRPLQRRKNVLDDRNGNSFLPLEDKRPPLPMRRIQSAPKRRRPVNLQPSKRRRTGNGSLSPIRRNVQSSGRAIKDHRPEIPRRIYQRAPPVDPVINQSDDDPRRPRNIDAYERVHHAANRSDDDSRLRRSLDGYEAAHPVLPRPRRNVDDFERAHPADAGPSYASSSSSRRPALADVDTPPPPPPDFRKTGYVEPPPPDTRPGRHSWQRRPSPAPVRQQTPPRVRQQTPPRDFPSPPRQRPLLARPEHRRLFCENLPTNLSWMKLKDFFRSHFDPEYTDVVALNNEEIYGVVEFRSREEALEACMTFNGVLLDGKPIRLRQDRGEFEELRNNKRRAVTQDGSGSFLRRSSGTRRLALEDGNTDDGSPMRRYLDDGHDEDEDEVVDRDIPRRSVSDDRQDEEEVEFIEDEVNSPQRAREEEELELLEEDEHPEEDDQEEEEDDEARSIAGQRPNHVYVGNLDFRVTSKDLKDHMKQAGQVLDCYILKDEDGKSKGCGFVEYSNEEEVGDALEGLHGSLLNDREITVKRAKGG